MIEQANHILQEIEVFRNIAKRDQGLRGNIHLALSPVFYDLLAAELLLDFRKRFEQANLVVVERTVIGVLEAVAKGKCDLGITGCQRDDKLSTLRFFEENHLAYIVFGEMGFSLFVNEYHPLANTPEITVEELSELDMVFFDNMESLLKKMGHPLQKKPMMVFDRITQKRIMAQSNLATIMPSMLGGQSNCDNVALCEIPIKDSGAMRSAIYFVYSADLPPSKLEQEVMVMIKEKYEARV